MCDMLNIILILVILYHLVKAYNVLTWWWDNQENGLAWSYNREYVKRKLEEKLNVHGLFIFSSLALLIILNY